MEPRPFLPWSGIVLAAIGAGALGLLSGQPWLAVAVLILWLGSLWLAVAEPPSSNQPSRQSGFTRDTMAELVEHSGNPLMLTERNRVTIANEAARAVLGAHVVGQDLRVALRHPEAIALTEREDAASTTVHNLARRRDFWRIVRRPLADGYAVIELFDQSASADLDRAHTDFVANASHELRTPLASIIGYVETLADEAADAAVRARFLDTILREARRLQQLVNDLLSLSRIEAEEHDLPTDRVALAQLVERAARDAAGPSRLARLSLDLAAPATVQGDTQQLEQMVRNVVDNALKYGAEDGQVFVTLAVAADTATLAVRDDGDGIPVDHLPHLTRRFYRVDAGRSRASGGTGLGLALVKHIVERHRGRLDIASDRDAGTTVTVRMPLAPDEPASHDTVTQV